MDRRTGGPVHVRSPESCGLDGEGRRRGKVDVVQGPCRELSHLDASQELQDESRT